MWFAISTALSDSCCRIVLELAKKFSESPEENNNAAYYLGEWKHSKLQNGAKIKEMAEETDSKKDSSVEEQTELRDCGRK